MVQVAATELKSNFKVYAGQAAKGEVVVIKRPKKEKNLIMIDEDCYIKSRRLLEYFARLSGYKDAEEMIEKEEMITQVKYSNEFMSLFGSLNEDDLIRPNQGTFADDVKREEL